MVVVDSRQDADGPVRVLLVVSSTVVLRYVRSLLTGEEHPVTVVGEARTGRDAAALVAKLRPSVVLLDLDVPGGPGLDVLEQVMAITPTPVLTYSVLVPGERALAAGAVDVVAVPRPGAGLPSDGVQLRRQLRVAARVRVIRHPRARLARAVAALPPDPVRPVAVGAHPVAARTIRTDAAPARRSTPAAGALTPGAAGALTPGAAATATAGAIVPRPRPALAGVRLVAIGASTGGPPALASLLAGLPADFPVPVLIVQHMAAGFLPGLACWLDGLGPLPVQVGAAGQRLRPGTVTLAPCGENTLVTEALRLCGAPAQANQFHVPSVDVTFASVASALGPQGVGVLLTGMGRDGAAGLLTMRERGATTIGQDAATCVVYGMPAAAYELGAVERQLPLPQIAPYLVTLTGEQR